MPPKGKGSKPPPRSQYFVAIRDQKIDTLRWCLRHGGVSSRTEDDAGHTGLQMAAAGGLTEAMELLIENILKVGTKDELDEPDEDGRTPLMMAAYNGKLGAVKMLVQKGQAPLGTKCDAGKTAMDYAVARKHDKIVAFLKNPKAEAPPSPEESEDEEEKQKGRVFRASMKLTNAGNEQENVHKRKVEAADALQAALSEAPVPVWEEVKAVLKETRRELSLRGKQPLPEVVVDPATWNCVCLHELRIEMGASFTSLSPRLVNLNALTTLIVSNNALRSLPDCFGALTRLRNLEAAHNAIEALPESLASVSGLQVVDFSHNKLSSASVLAGLTELVSVKLGSNALTALPEWAWESLEHLGTLAAPNNLLTVAPPGLGCLQMLVSLDLCDNKIAQIPMELGALSPKKLQAVRLVGNPLADPRIRRFVETDAPTLVKDLLNHVAKNGFQGDEAAGKGKKGKGKGKAKAEKPPSDDEDGPEGSIAEMLAALNASGSDSGEEPEPLPAAAPAAGKKKKGKK